MLLIKDEEEEYGEKSNENNNNFNMNEEVLANCIKLNVLKQGQHGHGLNWSKAENEHETFAGYLKKQGSVLKQWKERYFVLDSLRHQVSPVNSIIHLILYYEI